MRIYTLVAIVVWSVLPTPAMAYIDPGSGSAIMSAIIGALVAAGLALKTYWYNVKSLFLGKRQHSYEGDKSDRE